MPRAAMNSVLGNSNGPMTNFQVTQKPNSKKQFGLKRQGPSPVPKKKSTPNPLRRPTSKGFPSGGY